MSKSYIVYKDIAPGASDDAVATSAQASPFSDLQVTKERDVPPYITLETNRWLLDGTFSSRGDNKVSFWSMEQSDNNGVFASPPSINIRFTEQYSSTGVTLLFEESTGEYCNDVVIQWYHGGSLLAEKQFYPNATLYFCENAVVGYDQIILILKKTSLPNRRARLNQIVFGITRRYGMTDLRSVKIVNQMDASSIELPVSTMNWTLETKDPIAFMFQLKQPVECWNDDSLIGVYYIDDHKRKGKGNYIIRCHDALGVLDESTFAGGVYTNKSAQALFLEVVGGDFDVEFKVEDTTLTGAILPSTKRAAIQQIAFAAGWCISTDGRETIRVFSLDTELAEVGRGRTFPGAEVETAAIATQVRVIAHSYNADANGNVEINGTRYQDTQTVYTVDNPDVTANDKKNVKEIQGATLVSPAIGQIVAQRVYDYFSRRESMTSDIVWRGESLGDFVSRPTPWDTEQHGHIVKMEIRLSNTVVATVNSLGE